MNNRVEKIREQLTKTFNPHHLEVIDDSADHIGHHSYDAGGHFTVIISASELE
ncbi:MAG: BolA/IbaG family iron-sulfur metabolism protein, partial [Gammaproteobacteria bacterium]